MATKVYELAKELNMTSKEVLDKLNSMGIEAKSHMNIIPDMDCVAFKNSVIRGRAKSEETKIVKAVKTESEENLKSVGNIMKTETDQAAKEKKTDTVSSQANSERETQESADSKIQRSQGDRAPRPQGDRPPRQQGDRPQGDRTQRPQGDRPPRSQGDRPPRQQGDRPPRQQGDRPQGDRPQRQQGDRPPRPQGDRPPRQQGDRPPRPQGDRPPRQQGDRPPRPQGDRPPRPQGDRPPRPQGDRPPRPQGDRPSRPQGDRPSRPQGDRPSRPQGDRPLRPQGDRPPRRDSAKPEVLPEKPDRRKFDNNRNSRKQDNPVDKVENKNKQKKLLENKIKKNNKPYQKKDKDTRKELRREAARKAEEEAMSIPSGANVITVPITVKGLAEQIGVSTSQIIMTLMRLGIMANINQSLDEDTVSILADELHVQIYISKVEEAAAEEGIENFEDSEDDLISRPPIITVMGHVDHGKTSLLDRIRKTNITAIESGGITQHIGASEVEVNGHRIVFLDTPGHEAFTAMRARGAYITDIAVLVVAADDSVKPQTVEAISHAKAANVPIIVAINKIDKPGANIDRVKQDLTEHGILIEEWGGDVICVPVSAKSGEGIETLLEMILLQAEVLELKANPDRLAMGTVIEARLDNSKGSVATLLVLNGTLHSGMSIVAGTCSGRIRAMTNFKGDSIEVAGPATAVEILGLTDVPEAGDEFNAVKSDKQAREIADQRKLKLREEVMQKNSSVTLEELFSHIQEGEIKELNLIIKADVMGSVGALVSSLERLKNENVKVKIIHTGVGTVTESDIMLANTSNAIIIGFNVRPSTAISMMAEREGVEIRTYRIIYEVINDVEAAMKGMLDPIFKEVVIGTVEIRNTFKVPNIGIIGGGYVTDGKVERNVGIRLVRDGIVIHEGKISSLKRFKDDVKEVQKGYECGIGIENYNDIKEGDVIEAFKMEEIERK